MEKMTENDKLMARGMAEAVGEAICVLHSYGVIRCPGFPPNAPPSTFIQATTHAMASAISRLEAFAEANPLQPE